MNTSQYMDKQIMDLSTSHIPNSTDFIDFVNPDHSDSRRRDNGAATIKKEDIVPSYDFQPLRPIVTSSPRNNTSPIRNYGSLDSIETAKVISGKDRNSVDGALVSEIDKTMKKYADNLLHALEGLGARLSQLDSRTHQLENSMDDLKIAVGNNYGSSDGKMRQLENLLREVQTDVHLIKDKQEIMEAQFQLSKLQVSKAEQQPEIHNAVKMDNMQPATTSAPQGLPPGIHSTAPLSVPPPNSAIPPQQNLPQHGQVPNQFASSQIPPSRQQDSYYSQPGQIPESENHQYQMPPQQLQSAPPQQLPPQPQYQVPPQPQYSQTPPPQPQQPHPSLPALNLRPSQPPPGHHPEENPYIQSQHYPMGSLQPPSHSHSHTHTGAPLSQHFSGASPNMYEPQLNRLGSGVSGGYGSSSASGDPYAYGSPSQYGSGSPVKAPQRSAPPMGQDAGMGYSQLPTARILPQALPTASSVGGGSGSPGTGNRVPVDDVIDKVSTMGFSREQVRETVRRLTENGQSVDLNIVLDKLMNEDGQPPRAWFGR